MCGWLFKYLSLHFQELLQSIKICVTLLIPTKGQQSRSNSLLRCQEQLECDASLLGERPHHFHHWASADSPAQLPPPTSALHSKHTVAFAVMVWKRSTIRVLFRTEELCMLLHVLPSCSSFFLPLSCGTSSPSAGILFHFFPFCCQVPGIEGSEKHKNMPTADNVAFRLITRNEERPDHWADFTS